MKSKKTEFCKAGHPIVDREEFEQRVENIRPWPGEEFDVGECRDCRSMLSYPSALELH